MKVSILARSGDRALRCHRWQDRYRSRVSILARSGDRALPTLAYPNAGISKVSILARSGDRALQNPSGIPIPDDEFQSSPGLVTGRYHMLSDWHGRKRYVSILARSGDRALPEFNLQTPVSWGVSILARSGDRALQAQRAQYGSKA